MEIWSVVSSIVPSQARIYVNAEANPQGYYVSFDLTPDCGGATPCRVANLEARRGGDFYKDSTTQSPQLTNGVRGTYTNVRGSYYTALVQWKYQDVIYQAAVKHGRREDAIALANSAIQGGVRTKLTKASGEVYME
ncbi:MAG: hypothetical protein MUC48_14085 [Leptolyngbya sp. Prado105]|nr:hypothetical protein [Leptolyngbya sp. Prado105]